MLHKSPSKDDSEYVYNAYNNKANESTYVIFYREGCPDCIRLSHEFAKSKPKLDIKYVNTRGDFCWLDSLKAASGVKEVPSLYLLKSGMFYNIDLLNSNGDVRPEIFDENAGELIKPYIQY